MKVLYFLSVLFLISFSGYSQPDPLSYYAASRLDYYTDEEAGEVMVYVPDRLKETKITVDIVFEYEILNRGFQVASSGVSTVPFSTKSLREGSNEITVSFMENDKWVDSRKIFVIVRPKRDHAVKIERVNGGLYTNGLVMFPFGFFTYPQVTSAGLSQEAVNGFNMFSVYRESGNPSLKERKAYMNRCADLGMRLNYNLCNITGGEKAATVTGTAFSVSGNFEALKKEIEMFREHPALLTWFIADQPDAINFPPDSLLKVYNKIKELDPYHPVAILLSSPRNADQYRNAADIFMVAPYPVPQGDLNEVSEYARILKSKLALEKSVWLVPQAFGGNEWWKREPGPKEVRAMTYLAIINGAAGIQYFVRSAPNSFPKSTATWGECSALALEIAELTHDLLSPFQSPAVVTENTAIQAKAYNRAGLVTIIVVNEKPEPSDFKIKLEGVDLTIKTDVLFENRNIVLVDGVIEDFIDGYGTRIYRFDARLQTDKMKEEIVSNLAVDPGFEDISNAGVPASCFAYNGSDPGSTYFIDSRRHYQGEHSLRLNNPSAVTGNRLSFYGLELDGKKSYTVSIMAVAGQSSNKAGGKKGGPVRFYLGLGSQGKTFDCSDKWQNFQVSGVLASGKDETGRVCPQLELAGKGTAWFDLLQVYPDMEMLESPGTRDNLRILEIKCVHPDSKIFYTTDGSEPTIASTPYLVPAEIDKNNPFKAAAFINSVMVGFIER